MTTSTARCPYKSDFARHYWRCGRQEGRDEGRDEGRQEGIAGIVIEQMQLRGFVLSDAQRARVRGCKDEAQLRVWAARVLTARSVGDVLGDDA